MPRFNRIAVIAAVLTCAGRAPAEGPAEAERPFNLPLPGPDSSKSPATRYAKLGAGKCRAELRARHISTTIARGRTAGITTPLRLAGPLHGVRFTAPGKRSVYGALDCRLVLALDDFAEILERAGVAEVHADNFYRPRARLPGKKKHSQHAHGLAADVTGFRLRDGRLLSVEHDWQGKLGEAACGPDARLSTETTEALELRNLLCEVARAAVFHRVLTPNFNAAHRTHFHFDIARDAPNLAVH